MGGARFAPSWAVKASGSPCDNLLRPGLPQSWAVKASGSPMCYEVFIATRRRITIFETGMGFLLMFEDYSLR